MSREPRLYLIFVVLLGEAFIIVLLLVLTLVCGSPDRLSSMLSCRAILLMLLIAASWGKRALEKHERAQFMWLASERVLRAQAEHRLDKAHPFAAITLRWKGTILHARQMLALQRRGTYTRTPG